MTIIKQGDHEKIEIFQKKTKRFVCGICDCEFKADKGEYTEATQYDRIVTAICPCCGQTAYEMGERAKWQ